MSNANITNTFSLGQAYTTFNNVGPSTGRTFSQATGQYVYMSGVTVQGGFFTDGDMVTIEAACSKLGTIDQWNLALFWNTSASLTNAKLIGFVMDAATTDNTGYTYSIIHRRLQIINADGSGDGTYVWDFDYNDPSQDGYYTHDFYSKGGASYRRIGSNGYWDDAGGGMVGAATASMNWNQNFVIFVGGYITSLNDRIRTEWIKVSGSPSGSGIAK